MRPGLLTERVTIEKETRTRNTSGGSELSWKEICTVWAAVRPLTGRERERADSLMAEGGYRVTIRRRDDVNESCRVVWRDMPMNVRFAQDHGPRSLYLALECERGVST